MGDETSIDQQQQNRSNDNGNKAELRLPFGAADANSQPSCDNVKEKGQSSRKTKAEVAEMKAKEEALERKKERGGGIRTKKEKGGSTEKETRRTRESIGRRKKEKRRSTQKTGRKKTHRRGKNTKGGGGKKKIRKGGG